MGTGPAELSREESGTIAEVPPDAMVAGFPPVASASYGFWLGRLQLLRKEVASSESVM